MTTEPLMTISGVHKSFGSTRILHGIDLELPRGSRTSIVGPSGSGKTTLLRIIAGFAAATDGRIVMNGRTLVEGRTSVPPHLRNIGFVAQDGALFPHLSVGENIGYAFDKRTMNRSARERRIAELLEKVHLDPQLAKRAPAELSGGQQQRVALARALSRNPDLMLLDEPFSALDAGLRKDTRKAVGDTLAEAGITTLLVTHDQAEALSFSDQLAVMRAGKLAQVGEPMHVYSRPADLETARFLGDAVILDASVQGSLATCVLGQIPVRLPGRLDPSHVVRRGATSADSSTTTAARVMPIMLRPEQLRLAEDGPITGTVVETDFFGAEVDVTIRLDPTPEYPSPVTLKIRHWNVQTALPESRVRLRVVGTAVAYPEG
ncbi:ABC transporter ATP-binding protein [Neomicrococcus lactis]|uniref:ABC-type quaternary amine transporter n=1 Tax=Neomicrococcus lactis TaxID=732241 RepID=A0A7W8YBK2_9MICC|nr:ABC transporter ATP-binding protein [Neomicrococcus lactis]MBB5598539.1 iron(III) transport system ATP-binding protein [Neomicrococcus lactis]